MTAKYSAINGILVEQQDANLQVSDLALQRGYGIFDFLKTINGKPIFIENHLDRFFNSAKELRLEVGYKREELLSIITDLMVKNNIPNSGIKIILTGGYSEDGYKIAKTNLIIIQTPFEFNEASYTKGITLTTYNHQRQLASIKTIDYLQAIYLQPYIKEQGADDVLYHHDDFVRECPRANIFIVKENKIITPKTAILKGITRNKILDFKIDGYTLVEEDFIISDLTNIKEAFITSSTKNIMPVLAIDGKSINGGLIGTITNQLNDQLKTLIAIEKA